MKDKISRETMKALREEIDRALEALVKKHKLQELKVGHASFDPQSGSFTFQLKGVVEGGLTPEASRYLQAGAALGLPPLGSELRISGKSYTVVGINSIGSKVLASDGDRRVLIPVIMAADPRFLVSPEVRS